MKLISILSLFFLVIQLGHSQKCIYLNETDEFIGRKTIVSKKYQLYDKSWKGDRCSVVFSTRNDSLSNSNDVFDIMHLKFNVTGSNIRHQGKGDKMFFIFEDGEKLEYLAIGKFTAKAEIITGLGAGTYYYVTSLIELDKPTINLFRTKKLKQVRIYYGGNNLAYKNIEVHKKAKKSFIELANCYYETRYNE